MQCHTTKQLVHSFPVNTRISQPSKMMFTSVYITVLGLTNAPVNLKRMRQLYDIIAKFTPITVFLKSVENFFN